MPKRPPDQYITKEHGSIPNTNQQDDKPRMSTAAQQARRKIAQPRGRLGASRSHTPSTASPNPFSQNPSQQQSFGAVSGGVTFGASQSFPPSSTGTNSSFNFQPPQSSSFTFGAPSDAPNPFANLNGTSTGGSQDISMESPQKKTAFGNTVGANSITFGQPAPQQSNPFAGFGANQNSNAGGSNLFGQVPATSAPSNPFGQSAQSNPFGGFGQSSSTPQTQTTGFGGFGQSASASAPATSAPSFVGFGSTANSSNATTTAPFAGFGLTTSEQQNALPAFGAPQSTGPKTQSEKFVFGQTSSTPQPPSAALFGSSATTTQSTGNTLFGTSTSQPSATGFSFGQDSDQGPPATNPFAKLNTPKSEEARPATALFGASASTSQREELQLPPTSSEKPVNSVSDAQPANPFTGLFGGGSSKAQAIPTSQPAFSFGTTTQPPALATEKQETTPAKGTFTFGTTNQPPSKPAAEESQAMPAGSPFKFGGISQPASQPAGNSEQRSSAPIFKFGSTTTPTGSTTSGLFGTAAAQPEVSKAGDASDSAERDRADPKNATAAPTFKFGGPSPSISSGGLFSPAKPSTNSSAPSGGLFSKLDNAVETSTKPQPLFSAQSKLESPAIPASTAKAAADTSTGATESPTVAATPLFGGASQGAQPTHTAPKPQAASSSFGATPSSLAAPGSKASASTSGLPPQPQTSAEKVLDSAVTLAPNKRPVYTKGPTRVPGHTTAQQFQEYDRDYRLHSLNHGLRQKLSTLDPRSHDFDNVIRHYVAARDNIGASLGLYVRNVAGTKRKGDRVDDRVEEPEQSKRNREEPVQKSFNFGGSTSSGSASSTINHAIPSPSKTTRFLNDVIPKAASTSTTSASQPSTASKPTTKASAGFGSTSATGVNTSISLSQGTSFGAAPPSTTPVKSPPKKPAFELPQFGGGSSSDFFAAFGQQAKENSAKFEKDLMEKRKAEEFDSDEDDEEAYRKQVEEENRAKRAKIDAIAKGGFTPNFGSASTNTGSKPTFGGFGSASSSNAFSALAATPVSDGQSEADDEDDENEVSGSSNGQAEDGDDDEEGEEDDEEHEDSLPEDEVVQDDGEDEEDDDENDLQAAIDRSRNNPNAGKSLFERIEPNPGKEKSTPTTNGNKKESEDTSPIMQSAKNSSFPPAVLPL